MVVLTYKTFDRKGEINGGVNYIGHTKGKVPTKLKVGLCNNMVIGNSS